jgi:site-specific recombinase XerC
MRRSLALRVIATIRSKDIFHFIKTREAEGVGPNTIRLDLGVISRVYNSAIRNWGMESLRNPVSVVKGPKVPGGRTRRLEGDEERRLLEKSHYKFQ